jgi:AmiR/NasT family two-component response regulator
VINLAKGLLMERDRIDEDTAFTLLLSTARARGHSPAAAGLVGAAQSPREGTAG